MSIKRRFSAKELAALRDLLRRDVSLLTIGNFVQSIRRDVDPLDCKKAYD